MSMNKKTAVAVISKGVPVARDEYPCFLFVSMFHVDMFVVCFCQSVVSYYFLPHVWRCVRFYFVVVGRFCGSYSAIAGGFEAWGLKALTGNNVFTFRSVRACTILQYQQMPHLNHLLSILTCSYDTLCRSCVPVMYSTDPPQDFLGFGFVLLFRRLKPVSKGADGQWRRYEFLFKPSKTDVRDAASVGTGEVYERCDIGALLTSWGLE